MGGDLGRRLTHARIGFTSCFVRSKQAFEDQVILAVAQRAGVLRLGEALRQHMDQPEHDDADDQQQSGLGNVEACQRGGDHAAGDEQRRIGLRDHIVIRRIAADIVEHRLVGETEPRQQLASLGVARVSLGSGPMRAAMTEPKPPAAE